MWVIGVALLLLLTSALCTYFGRRLNRVEAEIWDIAGTARTYTTIVGTLAGFSVTSSIFIANLTVARQSANFEGVIALFLIAFLVFVSSAMQFGTTPNLSSSPADFYRTVQNYSYILANASFYLGLCLSWLGLPLLLSSIGLDYLGDIFIWLVLFAILGGALRISSSGLNLLAGVDFLSGLALPLLCFGAALSYRLASEVALDRLLPAEHAPTLFAVVSFVVAALGFSIQSAIVGSLREAKSALLAVRVGRALIIAHTAAVFTAVSLLWLAVLDEL
jgi:hypothetical protein